MEGIERDTWRRIESATRTTEKQVRTSHRRVTPPIRSFSLKVYKAIADASGGSVNVKAVKLDGTTTGDTVSLKTMTGMDVKSGDLVLPVTTADGQRAAYKGGGGDSETKRARVVSGSGATYQCTLVSTGQSITVTADGYTGSETLFAAGRKIIVWQDGTSWYTQFIQGTYFN